jgi:hypothetical protein
LPPSTRLPPLDLGDATDAHVVQRSGSRARRAGRDAALVEASVIESQHHRAKRHDLGRREQLALDVVLDSRVKEKNAHEFLSADATRLPTSRPNLPGNPPETPAKNRRAREVGEFVPARIETPTPSDVTGSYGPAAIAWTESTLGVVLRPWQAHALTRAFEHRADGSLRWTYVVLTVSRQSGKSVLARAACSWRLDASELFGEPQHVLSTANLRSTARNVWEQAAIRLERKLGALVRYGNGQEIVTLADGSSWIVVAANRNAGVGHSLSMVFVDEAWNVGREVVVDALAPTTLERVDPQIWLVSTAGEASSALLLDYRATAIAQASSPDTATVLIMEWSVPQEAAIDDVESWRQASPHWSPRRRDRVAELYRTLPERSFRRELLNQYVTSSRAWITDLQWLRCLDRDAELPGEGGTIAVESAFGSTIGPTPFGLVLAVRDADGRVIVRGQAYAGTTELWAAVEALAATRRGLTLVHAEQFRHHVPRMRGVIVEKVGYADQVAGYGPCLQAIAAAELRHVGEPALSEQVLIAASTTTERGTALSTRASEGPIFLARALVWAAGHELRPEQRAKPIIAAA